MEINTLLENIFTTERFKTKRSNLQLQNKTLRIIKTVKTQKSTQNYSTTDDDQKSDRNNISYQIIPLPFIRQH